MKARLLCFAFCALIVLFSLSSCNSGPKETNAGHAGEIDWNLDDVPKVITR